MIRKHQIAKQEQVKEEQAEIMKKLQVDHESQKKKLKEDQANEMKDLREKHKKEQSDLLAEQHKELREFHILQRTQIEERWKLYQNEQSALLGANHQEQLQTKQKHGKETDIPALKKEHEEEKNILLQKHVKETDLLKKQTEYDTQTLDLQLQKKRSELEASFANEPVFTPSTPNNHTTRESVRDSYQPGE